MSGRCVIVVVAALASLAGCSPSYQAVRMDVPAGAIVRIEPGVHTPAVLFKTPFVGRFEIGSLDVRGGIPLVFELDEESAKRYGANRAIKICARLAVGKPTAFAQTQTLQLAPSEDSLSTLVQGQVTEISAFVADPNENNKQLVRITMRRAPF